MSPSKYELQLEQASDLAEELTGYIVSNFTTMPLWVTAENGDEVYYEEAQDIYNAVYDKTSAAIVKEA